MLCRLPRCGNLRTLSIRDENNHNIFNSQRFCINVDDDIVDEVIEGLKFEKKRFFFEAGEKTSLILDVSSSKLSKSTCNKRLEFPPSDGSCVISHIDSIDAYGETSTRSIFKGSSSRLTKNDNSTSNNKFESLPLNDSCVISPSAMRVTSIDPYGYIKKYMEITVEENQGIKDWKESLKEMCAWYLENNDNDKNIHKFIIGAFCDLWMSYSGTSTTNTPFGFSTSEPPSPYFMSLIEAKADQIIATSTSSVIP
ncbi:transcription repressor OFP13-like [Solanum pennellii]|uniref:Transcription repressor n=1 Tax=Solanum pennellii TaxID=28526 RepID=A0ABM1FCU1_SOLPN|nr:transcription repressor OFP13-like [Solanum pennellii]